MKKMYLPKKLCILSLFMLAFGLSAHAAEEKKDTTAAQPKILPDGYMHPLVNDSIISYWFTEENDSIPWFKREYYQDDRLRDTLVYRYDYDTLKNSWTKVRKTVMKYNYNDVVTEHKTYVWNEVLQQWINQDYTRRTENSKLEVEARYTWNPIVEQWIGDRLDSAILDDGIVKFSYSSYSVDQNNNWIFSNKRENEHFYYLDSTKTISDYFIYQSDDQTYKHRTRTINVSDKDGQLIYRERHRDKDDVLQPESRTLYFRNENGQLELREEYEYQVEGEVWELQEYQEYQYNFYGKIILREIHKWDQASGAVIPYSKRESAYSGDQISQTINYSWNKSSDVWQQETKRSYTFDENDNLTESIESEWDANDLEWVLKSRTIREYDENGFEILEAEFETGIVDGQQETEIERQENEYEIDGKILLYYSSKRYRWDDDLQKLIGTFGSVTQSNTSGTVRQYVSIDFDTTSNEWYPQSVNYYYTSNTPAKDEMNPDTVYINDTVFISDNSTDTLFFTDTVFIADTVFIPDSTNKLTNAGFTGELTREVQLYPNPAKNYINIEMPSSEGRLEIWSLQGRKIFEQSLTRSNERIQIQHLKPGMYAVFIHLPNKSPLKFNLIKQ